MDTNHSYTNSYSRDSILNHIIDCANCALKDKVAFKEAMKGLAHELRTILKSEYCAIGTVVDGTAEDSAIDYEISKDEKNAKTQADELGSVRSEDANDDATLVSIALNSPSDISYFNETHFINSKNYHHYKIILNSGEPKNSTVIPIRDEEMNNYGFIQFMNTTDPIDYEHDILPYKDALLGLVQIIINNQKNEQELAKQKNRLRDFGFYNEVQDNKNNVEKLFDRIMEYFSEEFNAAVISFRIPLLNGNNKELIFYLRRAFVHKTVSGIKRHQLIEKLGNNKGDIKIVDEIRCDNQGHILESKSNTDYSQYGLDLDENTLVMPIFRDNDQKCINPQRKKDIYCNKCGHHNCIHRFKRLYGIFRLLISKTSLSNSDEDFHLDFDEIKERLAYLSKQITLLLNSIVDKHENESLQTFQTELENSSFIKIKDFDERCVEIIKKSIHAKSCSIYRYDSRKRLLTLSATTAKSIHFFSIENKSDFNVSQIKNSCFIHSNTSNNILTSVCNKKQCLYVYNIYDSRVHQSPFIETISNSNTNEQESALTVPMLNKDGTCAGVVLLLGKAGHKHSISTAYWEHDIKLIELIVNILTRISESDTERLTFLSRLSHELLAPVTELVYDNDFTANIAERNRETFSRQELIKKLRENVDRNMIFKYIVSDTEFIYSSSDRLVEYNIVKQEKPQNILLNAVRLLEKDANYKGLSIRTNISNMPPLYFDKERMMQVFINLLKNAIRYSSDRTIIDIFYKYVNNTHEIRFVNNGIGIQSTEKESIFELFHRGENVKKNFIRGTGMGLYIVRDIMRAHGGDCFVRKLSNPTEFVITLPD